MFFVSLASNHDPPNLYLLRSYNYSHELPQPAGEGLSEAAPVPLYRRENRGLRIVHEATSHTQSKGSQESQSSGCPSRKGERDMVSLGLELNIYVLFPTANAPGSVHPPPV
jgi:hypothetical protein